MADIDKGALEIAARAVHDAYLETARSISWPVKPENAVPFDKLTERAQDMDRATAEAAIAAYLEHLPKGRVDPRPAYCKADNQWLCNHPHCLCMAKDGTT